MKFVTFIARVLLGLVFVVFGSNAFLHFIPMQPMHGYAADFIGAMAATDYFKLVAAIQVIGGALVLFDYRVPLGLTLLVPVIVNIVCFHVFFEPAGLPLAVAVSALAIFLLWRHRESFAGILRA